MGRDLDLKLKKWLEKRNRMDATIKETEAAYLQVLGSTQDILSHVESKLMDEVETPLIN